MHSRIIQLTKDKLYPDQYIEENDFIGFDESISDYIQGADYVRSTDDRTGDIKWFKNYLCSDLELEKYIKFNPKKETLTFKAGFKTAFFQVLFDQFNQLTQELDLENFSDFSMEVWKLREIVNPNYGFRICLEEKAYITSLQDFVRLLSNEENETYYVGGVLDYHY